MLKMASLRDRLRFESSMQLSVPVDAVQSRPAKHNSEFVPDLLIDAKLRRMVMPTSIEIP